MKKIYVYNKLEIPIKDIEIPGIKDGIYYEKEEYYDKALDTLWLETSRKNNCNIIIDMNNSDCNITKLLYQFDNCNYFLVYNDLKMIKSKEYIIIDKINFKHCLKLLKKNFPDIVNFEAEAELISSGKKNFTDYLTKTKEYHLGF